MSRATWTAKYGVIDSATLVEVSSCLMGVNPGTATTSLKGRARADILDKDRSGGTMAFYAVLARCVARTCT